MAKAKRYRWVCGRCESAVLAPKAPRQDAVERYCLDCSAETGRLVERTCPALERQRQTKERQRLDRAKRKRRSAANRRAAHAREATRRAAKARATREEVAGDLHAELARIWPIALKHRVRDVSRKRPQLTLFTRSGSFTSGHAWWGTEADPMHRIHISVAVDDDASGPLGTLAHECAHLVDHRKGIHTPTFWTILVAIVREAYGAEISIDEVALEPTAYLKQSAIEASIRKARGYEEDGEIEPEEPVAFCERCGSDWPPDRMAMIHGAQWCPECQANADDEGEDL